MKRVEEFDRQLAGLVNVERAADYGHPHVHFQKTQVLTNILFDENCNMGAQERHAAYFIVDKLVRLCSNPNKLDGWIDIAGYARTVMMCQDRWEELTGEPSHTPAPENKQSGPE